MRASSFSTRGFAPGVRDGEGVAAGAAICISATVSGKAQRAGTLYRAAHGPTFSRGRDVIGNSARIHTISRGWTQQGVLAGMYGSGRRPRNRTAVNALRFKVYGHMYACMLSSMLMRRTALFLKEQQLAKLQKLSEKTGAPVAELIRRAIDAYLLSRKKELK